MEHIIGVVLFVAIGLFILSRVKPAAFGKLKDTVLAKFKKGE